MSATYARYTLQLNVEVDADVIAYLERQMNKNDAIRRALRTQIKEEQHEGSRKEHPGPP